MPDAQTSFTKDIPERIAKDPQKAANLDAVFLFKISGNDGGTWTVSLKEGSVGVSEGEGEDANCTIEMSSDDWKGMSDNPSSAMQLYFAGKIKVSGNAMLATKLTEILTD
ncbi:MAG: SCP2 sterol-binding domain-containing protein [Myxococcota bacterium]